MSVESSPEQWHNRFQVFCRTSKELIKEARSLQKIRFSREADNEKLAELIQEIGYLESRTKFLQKQDQSLSHKKVVDAEEQAYFNNVLEGGDHIISRIKKLMQFVLQQREKEEKEALRVETSVQHKEVNEWHHHIQHICHISYELVQTMNSLHEEIRQQGLTAKQERFMALAREHLSGLQKLDRTICHEKKITPQNKKLIEDLLKQCQKNLDEMGRMINPILHERYAEQRRESEREEWVEWQAPRGAPSDQSLRQEYNELCQEARQRLERGEEIDDELFAKLVAHRKKITGLFSTAERVPEPKMLQWHINYSVLKNEYRKAVAEGNLAMRQKIGFLMLQYLAKIAPPRRMEVRQRLDLGLDFGSTYHRNHIGGLVYNRAYAALFEKMTPGFCENRAELDGRLLLVDHQNVDDLLQLKYHLIEEENIDLIPPNSNEEKALVMKWAAIIEHAVADALVMEHPLRYSLKKKLLFNFTKSLEGDLQCEEGNKEQKAAVLKAKMDRIEKLLDEAILNAAVALLYERPHQFLGPYEGIFNELQLAAFIKSNSLGISQGTIDHISYMAELPLLQRKPKLVLPEGHPLAAPYRHEWLGNFIQDAGLKIGALRLSYHVFDIDEAEDIFQKLLIYSPVLLEVEYAPQGKEKVYYPRIDDLLQLRLLDQLRKTTQATSPQIAIPMQAFLALFTGMIQEIAFQLEREEENGPIHQLYDSPVVQSTLHRCLQHLAAANQNMHDTTEFTNAIELAHAELAALITLFQPYREQDFPRIFKNNVRHIPPEIQDYVKVGIGTSAMSVFTCLNASVAESIPDRAPEKAISKGIYYEEEGLLKGSKSLSQILEDEQVRQVDLYVAQIHHSMDPSPEHTHYAPTNVIEEVEAILEKKAGTKRLTVAIDCTIDFINSPQIQAILEHFSDQIKDGTLNFVFFGSGQKFAMLGQDNYYGAPFYVVNNGDAHWDSFKRLTAEERFHTDPISQQWFCLSTQYALPSLEAYREVIFRNTREGLHRLAKYAPRENKAIIVSTVDDEMLPGFIDIKFSDQSLSEEKKERLRSAGPIFLRELDRIFKRDGEILDSRGSFGFTHTNINTIERAIRITLGLDPTDIDRVMEALSKVEEYLED